MTRPEIVVPRRRHIRSPGVIVQRAERADVLMVRRRSGLRVTGVEPTLLNLGRSLENESFEIACEDARRRRLTSVPARRAYLERHGDGRPVAELSATRAA